MCMQAALLMPAGEPPVAVARHDVRIAACGYGPDGPSVADTLHSLERAAEVLKGHAMDCNEVNEDGLHVGIDEALNLTLYITSTASRLTEVKLIILFACIRPLCSSSSIEIFLCSVLERFQVQPKICHSMRPQT
jgi:hypothetical protein